MTTWQGCSKSDRMERVDPCVALGIGTEFQRRSKCRAVAGGGVNMVSILPFNDSRLEKIEKEYRVDDFS